MLVPGFLGSESSLATLAGWLVDGGFRVDVVDLELNARGSGWAVERIVDVLGDGPPGVLIGHSRGGQQSRVAVQRRPELATQLVTLGSPFRDHVPRHFVLRGAVETLRFASRLGLYRPGDQDSEQAYVDDLAAPYDVDVPFTSIWSRSDGFVAWQQSVVVGAESVEVDCSHLGLTASRASYRALAAVLDDPEAP